ncbi:MAG: BREX-1 system adenine-specific DNA-methyltransferase PglX, partial [Saccharofermentanales bacterium]
MDTSALKKYAQSARRSLQEQVSIKLKAALLLDSAARRENAPAVVRLEAAIRKHGQENIIERIAYTWFNRFSALRFMDVNHYTTVGVVSPLAGQSQPEILAEAKMGHIDPSMVPNAIRQRVIDLINGQIPGVNPQAEAYRLLIVAACNSWNQAMPFLFEKINDYTELLMPDDLLSEQSVLTQMRSVMTPESCKEVEIIGWLYQFYISEKKDEVFLGLKNNKKITPENIPAATQLFTPHWIVRYLVENSLGRLWMLNHPHSDLVKKMEYYIKPDQPESNFLKIDSPEEIRVCDPACGSGHMLVYAFDLLYAIYEEEGYDSAEIPGKILKNNLYGIEIDERAGELAAFALTMKARSMERGFFQKTVKPNICVLENVRFDQKELKEYMTYIGHDFFTLQLQSTLRQFEEADNFGSLIKPEIADIETMQKFLNAKNVNGNLFLYQTHEKVLRVLEQADYLSSKYHIVVANPPYMGGSGMNGRLASWIKDNYPDSKSDLFAVFIERNLSLARKYGLISMITMQSWMFLSSFEKLRSIIIYKATILSMTHLGAR